MLTGTPKIRGYIATRQNRIVLLYRQTNKVTYLVLLEYNRKNINLRIGSRFYGRIYPNRCDLSLDGKYFIYFAMGRRPHQRDGQILSCWTAICMPPTLTAQAIFFHGDTWGGGGQFLDDKTIIVLPGNSDLDIQVGYRFDKYEVKIGSLPNEGWASNRDCRLCETQIGRYGDRYPIPNWMKTNGKTCLLQNLKSCVVDGSRVKHGVGEYNFYEYEVRDERYGIAHRLNAECTWAEFDNLGRIVVATGSRIEFYPDARRIVENAPMESFDIANLLGSEMKGHRSR